MANTKSAKKQILINERNRQRNVRYRTQLKHALKKARLAIAGGADAAAAEAAVSGAVRQLYVSVSKGILKKQNASRRVGRIMLAYNKAFNAASASASA
ncbi:30S ribosomal protein S20 [bacterium]|nr:30S ribosomal protein S20 [bacterium]